MNAADRILAHAVRLAAKPALIHHPAAGGVETVSYGALAARVDGAARALVEQGVAPGDRVCLLMNDSPRFCAAFLGAIEAGAVAIPLNTRLAEADYAFILRDSSARLAIVDDAFRAMLDRARGDTPILDARLLDAADRAPFAAVERAPEDPAFWLYSSGTTGRPKGVIHTHAGCAQTGKLLREALGADDRFTVFATSKLFFAFALDNAFLGPLSVGATTILNEAWAEPEVAIDQAARYGPDVFFTVPSFFRRLLALGAGSLASFRAVRWFYTGGEAVPDSMSRGWREATGKPLAQCYGMSESFTNVFANRPGRERDGSCGEPLAGVETRLLDGEGRPAAADEPGVLWIKHPTLCAGYHDAAATARAFRDGWFCTNDRFTRDVDGYWWHHGRTDELLKVAGQWVKPLAIEEAALASGAAREAACVIVPDAQGFDRLALFVVPTGSDAEAARAAVAASVATLPRHSRPKWIRALRELPRTPTGKVQRFKLREMLLGESGDSA